MHDQSCVWGIQGQEPFWNPEALAGLVAEFGGTDIEFDGERLWVEMAIDQFKECNNAFFERGMAA